MNMFRKLRNNIGAVILITILGLVLMGATYVNLGPTSNIDGDIGVTAGHGYYIGDVLLNYSDVGAQQADAALTSISGLTYVEDSLIKLTANDTYAVRTLAEVKEDLSLNLVENTALSTWAGTSNITTLGTISTGSWNADVLAIGKIPTATVTDGDTTHVPTSDNVYAFCETTQNYAQATDKLSYFAATTSAELAGVISDETGSGALVFETALDDRVTQTTQDYTIYCNASTGSDETGDGTSGNPYATIQKCIDELPTIIAHDVIIAVGANETITSPITFAGHYCAKSLTLKSMDTSNNNLYDNGTADAGAGNNELDDTSKSWDIDEWNGGYVAIIQGTGVGQIRSISDTTATKITVSVNWAVNPDATSMYIIVMNTITGSGVGSGIGGLCSNLTIQGFRFSTFTAFAIAADAGFIARGTGVSDIMINRCIFQGGAHGVYSSTGYSGRFEYNWFEIPAGKTGIIVAKLSWVDTTYPNCFIGENAGDGTGINVNTNSAMNARGFLTFVDLDIGLSATENSIVNDGKACSYINCTTDYTPAAASDASYIE